MTDHKETMEGRILLHRNVYFYGLTSITSTRNLIQCILWFRRMTRNTSRYVCIMSQ